MGEFQMDYVHSISVEIKRLFRNFEVMKNFSIHYKGYRPSTFDLAFVLFWTNSE